MIALILVLVLPTFRSQPSPSAEPTAPFQQASPGATTPPPLSANMRENADRLFNRVMEARETGDSAGVKQFAPMGVMAYENAGELDNDGLYHLSLLQIAASDFPAALSTARRILTVAPDHLLALSAAADASALMNDSATARRYYEHFLRVLPVEKDKQLPEYLDHARVFPRLENEARSFLR
jgi:tetratricopeptide (TPR) repeat protein